MQLLRLGKFTQAYKKEAYIFAIVKLPKPILLPYDKDNKEETISQRIISKSLPKELTKFKDVSSYKNAITIPLHRKCNYTIDLLLRTTPLYRLIYPLF